MEPQSGKKKKSKKKSKKARKMERQANRDRKGRMPFAQNDSDEGSYNGRVSTILLIEITDLAQYSSCQETKTV